METGGLLKAGSLTERVHKVFGALTPVGATNADAALWRAGEFVEKLLTTLRFCKLALLGITVRSC
jgi:hypothetical protein